MHKGLFLKIYIFFYISVEILYLFDGYGLFQKSIHLEMTANFESYGFYRGQDREKLKKINIWKVENK